MTEVRHTVGRSVRQDARQPISNKLSSPIRITSLRLRVNNERQMMRSNRCCVHIVMRIQPHLFTMMAASSMMQLAPITMGPAMAKIVALGCTMVPELIVMSPLSSTSWHTTAFE